MLSATGNIEASNDAAKPDERGKVNKVVIDPGHGGKHPGCVYGEYLEKNITLGIALKLGDLIKSNFPEVEVIYTRTTDKYVDLAERGIIANKANADLFISIHINSATNSNARGTSTHVMGMDKSNKNLDVAMRENDVIIYEEDYTTKYEGYNPGDPASYIMFSLMQYAYQDQSMMFAEIIQKHFKADLPMPDRGTTQEPFLVLWRTAMPSVLTEVGFLSNQTDRTYVCSAKGQAEAARSLFNAFSEYKSRVEGRANVIVLGSNDAVAQAAPETSTKDAAPELQSNNNGSNKKRRNSDTHAADTRLVGQEAYDGVLYYVQIGFLRDKKPLHDKSFKSYRNRVREMKVPGRGYRYLIGGVKNYDEILKLQSEARKEFPDAFVVAYRGDTQVEVE